MPTVKMLGRLLPDVFNISIGFDPTIEWKWEETNQNLKFSYKIKDSGVEITCILDQWKPEYLTEIYKRAYDIIRAAASLVTFSTGNPLYVYLNRFVAPDGQETPLAVMNPDLVGLCTAFPLSKSLDDQNSSFDKVMRIVLTDPALFLALSDLSLAISHHDHITTGCARAVDGIRLMIWGGTTTTRADAKASWAKLQEALRASEQYLKLITENSMGARHGFRGHIPGSVTSEITKRSWTIMNRYLELRLRECNQLPEDFALLE